MSGAAIDTVFEILAHDYSGRLTWQMKCALFDITCSMRPVAQFFNCDVSHGTTFFLFEKENEGNFSAALRIHYLREGVVALSLHYRAYFTLPSIFPFNDRIIEVTSRSMSAAEIFLSLSLSHASCAGSEKYLTQREKKKINILTGSLR